VRSSVVAIPIYYAGYFGALGMFWPYFGPLLVSFGLSEAQATQAIAVYPLCGMAVPPLLGVIADAAQARRRILRILSTGAVLSFTGFVLAAELPWLLIPVALIFAVCRAPLIALVDASAVAAARAAGLSYGRLRLWGSLGFLGASLGAGELAARFGVRAVLPAALALLTFAAVASWFVPTAAAGPRVPVLRLWLERMRRPAMGVFLLTVMLAGVAHAAYDAGFSLHLEHIGLGGRFIGTAWAVGVGAEVLLMAASGKLLERWGGERLLSVAILVAMVRWALLAYVEDPTLLLLLAPLHGITFGLLWVSGVATAHQLGSEHAPTASQGMFVAASSLGSAIGMSLTGRALAAWGGQGLFLAASAVAALAATCALGFVRLTSREGRGSPVGS
jgi:PPP family 3-phenylpropionic acid transporter